MSRTSARPAAVTVREQPATVRRASGVTLRDAREFAFGLAFWGGFAWLVLAYLGVA